MSFLRFHKYVELYIKLLPIPVVYSTFIGIDIGLEANKKHSDFSGIETNKSRNYIEMYSNVIGYTGLGILTGIAYPVSYPLLGCYVLFKN